jgi:hypothetical protein
VTDRFPDMAAMARGATEDYSRIDSLAQIRPPFPAQGTPNWWALRKRLEELLARDQRRLGAKFTADARRRSELAKWTALGNEDAKERFEHGRGF